jgi:pimeloyl-ACP methyl ester carboxylesterase
MTTRLDPMGNPVQVGRSMLRTPGLTGVARALDVTDSATVLAEEMATVPLENALTTQGMLAQETIEIVDATEQDEPDAIARSTSIGEPAIVLEVPHPGDGFGQVVLAQDESGVVTWNVPRTEQDLIDVARADTTLTYVIRRHVPRGSGGAQAHGLFGAVGSKLLKVLVFPLVDKAIGAVAEHFAERWEERHRPYRLRTFTAEDHAKVDGSPVPLDVWEGGGGRMLLLVHGTFSRAHHAFSGVGAETLGALQARYGGGVVAFDHFTLSHDPDRNVDELLNAIPDRAALKLDIVCHSRGGLVARELAERQSEISLGSRTLEIEKVVFVATPNAGTVLADGEHIGALVDRYTTILNLFPDNGVTEALEAVITVVKHLAVGALTGLDGLAAMRPGGPYLASLNREDAGSASYRVLAADYEPTNPGLKSLVRDGVMDRIFGEVENDLVVPTAGVWEGNGATGFPVDERQVFAPSDGIQHSGFFHHPAARERLLHWLTE